MLSGLVWVMPRSVQALIDVWRVARVPSNNSIGLWHLIVRGGGEEL